MNAHLTLDHLVCTVPDVRIGSAVLGTALGITPTAGGSHPDLGTCNVLLSLGAGQYLELLGPDPAATHQGPMALRAASRSGPDICTFAVVTNDIDALAEMARAQGLEVRGPVAGSRRDPTGVLLRWRILYLVSAEFKGLVPFVIDWLDTPHPSLTATRGVQLQSMVVTHPRPHVLSALYAALGLEMTVHHGLRGAIIATLVSGERVSTWVGSAEGLP
ncbi:MAG: VOC family protein [Gammaproteobacteria bacterium]